MICKNCGTKFSSKNPDVNGYVFCPECGKRYRRVPKAAQAGTAAEKPVRHADAHKTKKSSGKLLWCLFAVALLIVTVVVIAVMGGFGSTDKTSIHGEGGKASKNRGTGSIDESILGRWELEEIVTDYEYKKESHIYEWFGSSKGCFNISELTFSGNAIVNTGEYEKGKASFESNEYPYSVEKNIIKIISQEEEDQGDDWVSIEVDNDFSYTVSNDTLTLSDKGDYATFKRINNFDDRIIGIWDVAEAPSYSSNVLLRFLSRKNNGASVTLEFDDEDDRDMSAHASYSNGKSDSAYEVYNLKNDKLIIKGEYASEACQYTINGNTMTLIDGDEKAVLVKLTPRMEIGSYDEVGDIVLYGHYEQDNNMSNGKEPIAWIVLDYDAENNRALLLSEYIIDFRQFHSTTPYPTWEKSDIRAWLNSDFLNNAFSEDEKKSMITTTVKTNGNDELVTYDEKDGHSYSRHVGGGNDTQDKLFLLSLEEVIEYRGYDSLGSYIDTYESDDYAMFGFSTKYTKYVADGYCDDAWWLRSPDGYEDSVCQIGEHGGLSGEYIEVSHGAGIRPAFWLDLNTVAISGQK